MNKGKGSGMELTLYQVDAFADEVFKGNPAAIVPLECWLGDETLQAIALENNLSETAYFIRHEDGVPGHYHLRWFTPRAEVDLCGHATLASAFVLFEFLGEQSDKLAFETRSGALHVERGADGALAMDFPAQTTDARLDNPELIVEFEAAIGTKIEAPLMRLPYSLFVLESEADLRAVHDLSAIGSALERSPFWALLITAPADEERDYDFVSRFFAPGKGVPEDPATGSAHCLLAPYWAERLGKSELVGYQASQRGGVVHCAMNGGRVTLSGKVSPYLQGRISIPDIG